MEGRSPFREHIEDDAMADEELRPLGAGVINSLSDDNPPSRQFTYCTATFSRPKVLARPFLHWHFSEFLEEIYNYNK